MPRGWCYSFYYYSKTPAETSMTETQVTDCGKKRLVGRPGDHRTGLRITGMHITCHDANCCGGLTKGISSLGRTEVVMVPRSLYSSLCEPQCNASDIRADLRASCQPMPPTLTISHCIIQYCLSLMQLQGYRRNIFMQVFLL